MGQRKVLTVHTFSVLSCCFTKIKTTQDTLAQMITERRRSLAHENQEREIEREHK